jgi:hypothetical protein
MLRSRSLAPWLVALVLLAGATAASAQVDILPPDLLAKLTSANEKPLALAPDGEALRFRNGAERWEEAMPPGIVDVDRDGTKDYIILILADEDSGRRALVARVWGDAADAFGPTVFYVVLEDDSSVVEWAGTPRLPAPARPKP